MIYYFSATGNSQHVATRIAEALGTQAQSIETAVTPTNGVNIIEAVERTDKPFFVGVQFHPEVAVNKHVNKDPDASRFMSYDEAMRYFRALVKVR
jgi:gamma-glutamyl-gamma-aminobutyrate hydrolase PuuD